MGFSDVEYVGKGKQTRCERLLAEMNQVVPWDYLLGLMESLYPKAHIGADAESGLVRHRGQFGRCHTVRRAVAWR